MTRNTRYFIHCHLHVLLFAEIVWVPPKLGNSGFSAHCPKLAWRMALNNTILHYIDSWSIIKWYEWFSTPNPEDVHYMPEWEGTFLSSRSVCKRECEGTFVIKMQWILGGLRPLPSWIKWKEHLIIQFSAISAVKWKIPFPRQCAMKCIFRKEVFF